MREFAAWLSKTPPSVFIQEHWSWAVPAIHVVHLVGVALVIGSALMINLRVLGLAAADQTLQQTSERFRPWLTGALWVMVASGLLMVIGEPVRELVTLSFWLKMTLLVMAILVTAVVQRRPRASLAIVACLLWFSIIGVARLIPYDWVWASWSPVQ